jgi:hypothetical protein
MKLSSLIRSTLSGIAGIGLAASSGCTCDDIRFSVHEEVTDRLLQRALGAEENVDDEAVCEAVCREVAGYFLSVTLSSCELDVELPPPRRKAEDGELPPPRRKSEGGEDVEGAEDEPRVVGMVRCAGTGTPECIGGRRPMGHVAACSTGDDALGRSFAELAHLEGASVVAFLQLSRQLEQWGAPQHLVRRCRDAARDELVHAKLMSRFARERGVAVPALHCSPPPDELLAAAIHNASEGCVNEAWAALLAHVQAAHAADPSVRDAFTVIAADEARHAQLAWDLHAWFSARLDAADRRRVAAARTRAAAKLSAIARSQARGLPAALGIPEEVVLTRLAEDFGARLAAA